MSLHIGVLAFHGDVVEHISTAKLAAKNLNAPIDVIPVRTKNEVNGLAGLILPGGESTTLHKLCVREDMWDMMKKIPCIFGTCAGAIMLAKTIHHRAEGQETLERMNVTIDRNAYGRQSDSFEEPLKTSLGTLSAIYIRAPKIETVEKSVSVLAKRNSDILACEETSGKFYNLATTFHPELTTTLFHEYFIQKIIARGSDIDSSVC